MENSILILGGRSLVAPFLMRRLAEIGREATVVSRKGLSLPAGFTNLRLDIESTKDWQAPQGATIISLLPLWVLSANLRLFEKANAIIAVGSTSRFGKAASEDPKEKNLAEKLAYAEAVLENWARQKNVSFTILRPTLIYDGIHDQNIARIARIARRYRFFPVAKPAKGLRQPIHADDVAKAIMGCLDNKKAANKSFNIAGGEILSYRAMVEKVFESLGRKPRLIALPVPLLEKLFRFLTKAGILKEQAFGFGAFKRMNEHLVFDCSEGLKILAYAPRLFHPDFKR